MSASIVPDPDSPRQLSLFDPVEIPLAKGYVTLVDPIDADLMRYRWRLIGTRSQYVSRTFFIDRRSCYESLHKVIMIRKLGRSLVDGEYIDHIDGNPLNNTRGNLRLCTLSQNNANAPRQSRNTSGYKGVSFLKNKGKWQAKIAVNKRRIYLGLYDTPEAAHAAYCEAAKKHFGEFARFE